MKTVAARLLAAALAAMAVRPASAGGQEARRNEVSLDATALGVSVGYARGAGAGTRVGFGAGVGGDVLSVMLVGGRHFAESCCIAYEARDAGGGELLFEMAHVGAFLRRTPSERFEYDVGLRASAFLHFDDSDDDPGGGLFGGVHAAAFYGWRNLKFGPQVLIGAFHEGRPLTEFGVLLTPISVRGTVRW